MDLFLVVIVGVLVSPALELPILSKQEFEGLADDVGRTCANELGVPVQVVSDLSLQVDL